MSEQLIAFHGKASVKKKYVDRVKEHKRLDQISKGVYWSEKDGKIKGCAVGCTLERTNIDLQIHRQYEIELGLPEWLAILEDRIFENLPDAESKEWPVKFLEAIPVGKKINEKVLSKFMVILMLDKKHGNITRAGEFKDVEAAIKQVAKLHKKQSVVQNAERSWWFQVAKTKKEIGVGDVVSWKGEDK